MKATGPSDIKANLKRKGICVTKKCLIDIDMLKLSLHTSYLNSKM